MAAIPQQTVYPSLLVPKVSDATPKSATGGASPAFDFSPSKRAAAALASVTFAAPEEEVAQMSPSPSSSAGFQSVTEEFQPDVSLNLVLDEDGVQIEDPAEATPYEEVVDDIDGLQDLMGVCLQDAGRIEEFADFFGGGDSDSNAEDDSNDDEHCQRFAMCDSSSDDDAGSNMDLEDAYNFDHERIAEMARNGADHETLIQAAQEGMTEAFLERMQDVGYVDVEGADWWDEEPEPAADETAGDLKAAEPAPAAEPTNGIEASVIETPAEATAAALSEELTTAKADSADEEAKSQKASSVSPKKEVKAKAKAKAAGGARRLFGHALNGLGNRRNNRKTPTPPSDDDTRRKIGESLSANMTPQANTPEIAATPAQANTPGNATPSPVSPKASGSPQKAKVCASPGVPAEEVAERLRESPAREEPDRRLTTGRRSSVRRDSIECAMRKSLQMHRKSVSKQVSSVLASVAAETGLTEEEVSADIKTNVRQVIRSHRLSMEKAADILEDADIDDDDDEEKAQEHLKTMQKVLAEASRRHRKAIAEAVQTVVTQPPAMENIPEETNEDEKAEAEPAKEEAKVDSTLRVGAAEFKPKPGMRADATEYRPTGTGTSVQDKIQDAVREAYMRKIANKPVAAAAIAHKARGQGPAWTPGTVTEELSLQDRMKQAAKEAQERRKRDNGADVAQRIAQAMNDARNQNTWSPATTPQGYGETSWSEAVGYGGEQWSAAGSPGYGSPGYEAPVASGYTAAATGYDVTAAAYDATAAAYSGYDSSAAGYASTQAQDYGAAAGYSAAATTGYGQAAGYAQGYGAAAQAPGAQAAGYAQGYGAAAQPSAYGAQAPGYGADQSYGAGAWNGVDQSWAQQQQPAAAASQWAGQAQWPGAAGGAAWDASSAAWTGY